MRFGSGSARHEDPEAGFVRRENRRAEDLAFGDVREIYVIDALFLTFFALAGRGSRGNNKERAHQCFASAQCPLGYEPDGESRVATSSRAISAQ